MKKIFILLLVVHIVKEIVWIALVPLWHFPDEQSHVAQVTYIAEKGVQPDGKQFDLTEEIRKSEELLGTERDERGNNRFTYHPEYKIPYSETVIGLYEREIQALSNNPQARDMVKHEASKYPMLYYTVLSWAYRALYTQDIFLRVYSMRLIQVLFSVGIVYASYHIGRRIFADARLGLAVAALVSFHPMVSFVGAGINSDNIGTFVFTLYILMVVKVIAARRTIRDVVLFILLTYLVISQKPQFLIVLPASLCCLLVVMMSVFQTKKQRLFGGLALGMGALGIVWFVILLGVSSSTLLVSFLQVFDPLAFVAYAKDYMVRHLYREVLPWYWGVYDWLGVTYPRVVHRTINWIGILAIIGFIPWLFRRKRVNLRDVVMLIGISVLLVVGIYGYDWWEWSRTNVHLGVQGRYFFPTITAHMSILLLGLTSLVPIRYRYTMAAFVVGGMIVLNTYALWLIAKTYYDVSAYSTFVVQASQYKPWFFKGAYLSSLVILYFGILILFLINVTQCAINRKFKTGSPPARG